MDSSLTWQPPGLAALLPPLELAQRNQEHGPLQQQQAEQAHPFTAAPQASEAEKAASAHIQGFARELYANTQPTGENVQASNLPTSPAQPRHAEDTKLVAEFDDYDGGPGLTMLEDDTSNDTLPRPITDPLLKQEPHKDGRPKRPLNAFMIFSRHRRPQILNLNHNLSALEITGRLSEEWKQMPFVSHSLRVELCGH